MSTILQMDPSPLKTSTAITASINSQRRCAVCSRRRNCCCAILIKATIPLARTSGPYPHSTHRLQSHRCSECVCAPDPAPQLPHKCPCLRQWHHCLSGHTCVSDTSFPYYAQACTLEPEATVPPCIFMLWTPAILPLSIVNTLTSPQPLCLHPGR